MKENLHNAGVKIDSQTTSVTSHFSASGTITQPEINDWYEFYIDERGYPVGLTLITVSTVPGDNVNLYVYDSNFNKITSSTLTSRQDTITFVPTKYGKYLINVERV